MKKRNLFTMDDLTNDEILSILQDAVIFSNSKKDWQLSKSYLVANLFFEPSTRTQYSFIAAQEKLGCKVIDFNSEASSLKKGETLYDTVKTFECIGYDALVIRHPKNYFFDELKNIQIPIINGGDGLGNHPSQCLLDLLTIYQEFKTFKDLNIVIIGDIRHSRVAHSNYETLQRFGANVQLSGSKEWIDNKDAYIDIDDVIQKADVVMLLRIQYERHAEEMQITQEEYLKKYGLTLEREKKMKSNAIIMHPAPVNRGVEIDDALVECERSRIFKQVQNGMFIRQAIMKFVLGEEF